MKERVREDIAEEYCIVEKPEAYSGIILFAKYNGKWMCNPWSPRPIIRHLLVELAIIPRRPELD